MGQRSYKSILPIAVVTILLSLVINVYLWYSLHKVSAQLAGIAESYAKLVSGSMVGLNQLLYSAQKSNWSDSSQLWSISSVIQDAEIRAQFVAILGPFVPQDAREEIQGSRLADLWPDLQEAAADFSKAATDQARGLAVNTRNLQDFSVKVRRARFPSQSAFSWHEWRTAIDRYFGK